MESVCEHCGLSYEDLRTGFSFEDVRDMLWTSDNDSSMWKNKSRGVVLGFWRELKRGIWRDHLALCKAAKEVPIFDEGYNEFLAFDY